MSALTKAKTFLQLTDPLTLDNALDIAEKKFGANYSRWKKLKYMPDTFNCSKIEFHTKNLSYVTFPESIILKMYKWYEIQTDDEEYIGAYTVIEIDYDNNRVLLDMPFLSDKVVEFSNTEKDIYETALAWYICGSGRYTNQQIISGKFIVTSTQIGNGNITTSGVDSIAKFQMDLIKEGDFLLNGKEFPCLA